MVKLTLEDIRAVERREKHVRLASLAQFINDNMSKYEAKMKFIVGSNDRKSGRLRIPGKDYAGNMLIVYLRGTLTIVLEHNPFKAYRENREVAEWIVTWMKVQ